MQEKIKFKSGDLFFEPVLAFFSSFIGHMAIANGMTIYDKVMARFRGEIVSQVTFDEPLFLYNTYKGNPPSELNFTFDSAVPVSQGGRSIDSTKVVIF
jgi:hypothetical protein